jgi:hypothetical protein
MANYLTAQEKSQIAQLQLEIDAIAAKAQRLQGVIAKSQQAADALRAELPAQLLQLANSDNPLSSYDPIFKLKLKLSMLDSFVVDMQPVVQSILDSAEPLREQQRGLDSSASKRLSEINRLQAADDSYGLTPDQQRSLEALLAAIAE